MGIFSHPIVRHYAKHSDQTNNPPLIQARRDIILIPTNFVHDGGDSLNNIVMTPGLLRQRARLLDGLSQTPILY
jgi:hypothetical protein